MITKRDLELYVSRDTGIPLYKVAKITNSLIETMRQGLVHDGKLRLDGFGTFTVAVVHFPEGKDIRATPITRRGKNSNAKKLKVYLQVRIHFSKSVTMRKMLKKQHGGSHAR